MADGSSKMPTCASLTETCSWHCLSGGQKGGFVPRVLQAEPRADLGVSFSIKDL